MKKLALAALALLTVAVAAATTRITIHWTDSQDYVFAIAGSPSGLVFTGETATSLSASWTKPDGTPDTYTLQASTASDFTGTVTSSQTVLTSATLPNLSTNTVYYARVKSTTSGTDSAYSNVASMATNAVIPAGGTISGLTGTGFTVTFTNGGNPSPTIYDIDVSSVSGFASGVTTQEGTSLARTLTGLDSSKTYYSRARAVSYNGSETSYTTTVTTATNAGGSSQSTTPTSLENMTLNGNGEYVNNSQWYGTSYCNGALHFNLGTLHYGDVIDVTYDRQGYVPNQGNTKFDRFVANMGGTLGVRPDIYMGQPYTGWFFLASEFDNQLTFGTIPNYHWPTTSWETQHIHIVLPSGQGASNGTYLLQQGGTTVCNFTNLKVTDSTYTKLWVDYTIQCDHPHNAFPSSAYFKVKANSIVVKVN